MPLEPHKKHKNLNRIIILVFCILVASCKTETKPSEQSIKIEIEEFQSIIDSIYKANPQSIGIIAHIESPKNRISWSGSAGYSNKDTQTELLPDEPALIASSIKTYVSATILRLQEEGKLDIENPIENHLSRKTITLFEDDGYKLEEIKIKHLLSHTSGIDDYVNEDYFELIKNNPKYRWTRDEQLKLSVNVGSPLGQPQEVFKYADVNYLLATEIIEQKTQKPFYTAMRELLKYDELGLINTWFPTLEEKPANTKKLVHQYWNEKEWGERKMNFDWDSYNHDISWDLYGGGGIATNMKELAQFSYDLFNGKIIKDKAVLNLIKTDVTTTDGIPKTYRVGVADTTIKGLQSLGHGGFWGTIVFYIPQLDASISVCVLERNGKMKIIESLLNTITTELTSQIQPSEHIVQEQYELYKVQDSKATLVLFPGGASTANETKEEFDIMTTALANQVSVLFMNFNHHLWIDETATKRLNEQLNTIFNENDLKTDDIYIGGISVGGNVALTLSNHLHQNNTNIVPKGTFIVDSPIDLYALYESSLKDIANPNFDKERLAEPKWIINYFEEEFAKDSLLQNIQKVSPFTLENKFSSIPNLKSSKLRFYIEPDSLWWKENRQTDFESTNAYTIQQIAKDLKAKNWNQFELIETENKGYRANGNRHPHSWSIVDKRKLMEWIKE
ncbi:MAG: beta-lactamase family protein [Psychroserpens sp.]|nr:beta-lactamase family protein [Psychroserpens sp.]